MGENVSTADNLGGSAAGQHVDNDRARAARFPPCTNADGDGFDTGITLRIHEQVAHAHGRARDTRQSAGGKLVHRNTGTHR